MKATGPGKSVVVCICGMAGSGKSTVAKRLAEKYRLQYYSGGDALKALAADRSHDPSEVGWWETTEGLNFVERRNTNPTFDKEVDGKLLEIAQHGNVVLDSWTMPWLLDLGFKIWLEASQERRAERIARRDRISVDSALTALKSKEEGTKAIYKKLYGFNLGEDFAPFQFILDVNDLKADEVFQVLCKVFDHIILKNVG